MKYLLFLLAALLSCTVTAQQNKLSKKERKEYEAMIARCNAEPDSTTVDFYYKRGNIHYDYFNYREAIADYSRAIAGNPLFNKAYYNRGLAKLDSGLYDDAIADFNKTLEISPNDDKAYNNRGICHFYKKEYPDAITDAALAIQSNPKNAEAYQNKGMAEFRLGLKDKACLDFERAYELGNTASLQAITKLCN